MPRWTCPACGREFGRAHQSHTCVPGNSVDDTFAGSPPYQRPAYDAIIEHLSTLGPLHLDAVSVGVFLLHDRKFAEIRPKARSLQVALRLDRTASHRLVSRHMQWSGSTWHIIKLTSPDDVDDGLRELLTEAYLLASD